jgi:hypothetical protein
MKNGLLMRLQNLVLMARREVLKNCPIWTYQDGRHGLRFGSALKLQGTRARRRC